MLKNVIRRAVVLQIRGPKDNLTTQLQNIKKYFFHWVPLLLVVKRLNHNLLPVHAVTNRLVKMYYYPMFLDNYLYQLYRCWFLYSPQSTCNKEQKEEGWKISWLTEYKIILEKPQEGILIHKGMCRQYFIVNITLNTHVLVAQWPPIFSPGWSVINHNSPGFTYLA